MNRVASFRPAPNLDLLLFWGVGNDLEALLLPFTESAGEVAGMLQTKTSGNLNDDETQSLDSALTDLKFAYVRIQQRTSGGTH